VKISRREKTFIISGGIVALAALLFYLAMVLLPSREGLSREVQNKKNMLLRQRELLGQEERYRTRIEQYRQRLKQDMLLLLPGENPSIVGAELQKVLREIADRNGVEIIRRDTQREQPVQDNLVKISVRIETSCTPEQLVQFIAAVDSYEKFLTLDELIITSFRVQRRWEIRPAMTVSGYIAGSENRIPEKAAGGK
jgi:hypothetical protein